MSLFISTKKPNELLPLILTTFAVASCLSTAYAQSTDKIDGLAIEKEFDKDGPGSRYKIEVPADLLVNKTRVSVGGGQVQLGFNTSFTWAGPPFYFRQIDDSDTFNFPYMVSGMAADKSYAEFTIPFGPGTVCEVYGTVNIFGVKIEANKERPLIFIVYSPSGREDREWTINPVDLPSWPPQPFPSGHFPDPVFWPATPTASKTTDSSPQLDNRKTQRQLFLVHIAGTGYVTKSDGNRVELKGKYGAKEQAAQPSSGRLAQYLLVVVEEWALLSRGLSGEGGPLA